MSVGKKRSLVGLVGTVLFAVILLCAAAVAVTAVVCKSRGRPVVFFGYSFHVVVTDSMSPEIAVGDLIVARNIPFDEVRVGREEGDNVVFSAPSGPLVGNSIIHRAVERTAEGLRTQGVKQGAPVDDWTITEAQFIGIQVGQSAFWGGVVLFLSRPLNWLLIALLLVCGYVMVRSLRAIFGSKKEGEDGSQGGSQ